MEKTHKKLISVIIPSYNEAKNIPLVLCAIDEQFKKLPYSYEIIFVNDGSKDDSMNIIETLQQKNTHVHFIDFSRNFGKEIATTAGLRNAHGDAAILIDADLQHPPELIPHFLTKWEEDFDVVIAVRKKSKSDGVIKRTGSRLFYKIMDLISETKILPNATDFRLLDRKVIDAFNSFTEHHRMTRGLIDWLGFKRATIEFEARTRAHGEASYSLIKLVKLATESFISHSLFPLRFAGYLGIVITFIAALLGTFMFLDRYILHLGFEFSGPAILAVIILFLVGIILICLGLLAYYIGQIHSESQNRPLYIERKNTKKEL